MASGLGRLVDWQALFSELKAHGYGPTRVAAALNLPKQTVWHWSKHNSEPEYTNGHLLIKLHRKVVDKKTVTTRFGVIVR